MKLLKTTTTVMLLLLITSCTNSKVLISPIYNRLDDQMRGEFHKLAKWNDEQIEHFEKRVGTFHVWHRQNELPKYATLLSTIASSIAVRNKTTEENVNAWVDEVEQLSYAVRDCHPVNFSYDLMNTLSDKQVNFIEKRFINERKMNFEKYSENTPEERQKKRVENVVKWAGRIGFDFSKTQEAMLAKTLSDQVSLRSQYYQLVDQWSKDLFVLARKQNAPDYEVKMQKQVSKIWTLLEDSHNDEWLANRKLWREFAYDFVQTLDSDQRVWASNWIGKMAKTIQAISEDEPSFKLANKPEHGCKVATASAG